MKVQLSWQGDMHLEGMNEAGNITSFDSHGTDEMPQQAATPMEIMLQSMAACSMMDVLSILSKKRKVITGLDIRVDAQRAETHPRVFTAVHLEYILISPDAEIRDLERAVELSQSTYCSASAMFRNAGCAITTVCTLQRP
jgi:putative redox protein